MEYEIKKIKAIRTISKEEMMKMKRMSPYLVDEIFFAICKGQYYFPKC